MSGVIGAWPGRIAKGLSMAGTKAGGGTGTQAAGARDLVAITELADMLATGRRIDRGADRRRTVSRRPESHCTPHSADDAARRRRPRAGGAALLRGRHRGRVRRRFGHRAWRVRQPRQAIRRRQPAGGALLRGARADGAAARPYVRRAERRSGAGLAPVHASHGRRRGARRTARVDIIRARGPDPHPVDQSFPNPPSTNAIARSIASSHCPTRAAPRSGCPDRARCASRFPSARRLSG